MWSFFISFIYHDTVILLLTIFQMLNTESHRMFLLHLLNLPITKLRLINNFTLSVIVEKRFDFLPYVVLYLRRAMCFKCAIVNIDDFALLLDIDERVQWIGEYSIVLLFPRRVGVTLCWLPKHGDISERMKSCLFLYSTWNDTEIRFIFSDSI